MTRAHALAAFACLAVLSACHRPDTDKSASHGAQPDTRAAVAETLSPEQLTALAFRAAWGSAPPATHETPSADGDPVEIVYASARLVPMGGDRFALVSDGKGGDAHVDGGALAIHYLKRTATGFDRIGSWPEFVFDGTFGAPPDWAVRTDLTDAPALLTKAGGTWQGYTCEWSSLIELTPDKPVMRSDDIPVGYDSSGASEDGKSGETLEGTITPGTKGRSFVVNYGGARTASVTYALAGDAYTATSDPDLPAC
ncbi:hypothetical protein BH10PSE2_BH10PSE2_30720 [soil metagenome]